MRIQIFNEDKDKVFLARPYDFKSDDNRKKFFNPLNASTVSGELPTPDNDLYHSLTEPYIDHEHNRFCTKKFYVRYSQAKVVLRDVIQFRTEIDMKEDYLKTKFFLKAELFHRDIEDKLDPEEMQEELEKNPEFELCQEKVYQINNCPLGR